jgi:hypothetical protein
LLAQATKRIRFFKSASEEGKGNLTINAEHGKTDIKRIAVRFSAPIKSRFIIGPYTFATNRIQDPSDYLDFTREEIKKMQQSGEWDKLRRSPKMNSLVGRYGSSSLWVSPRSLWRVSQGECRNRGIGAVLIHGQEIISEFNLSMQMQFLSPSSQAVVQFYSGAGTGEQVYISGGAAQPPPSAVGVSVPNDGKKHKIEIQAGHAWYMLFLDGKWISKNAYKSRSGGKVSIRAESGTVSLDDIEFSIPRQTKYGSLYAFDRRETDWWREGTEGTLWIDHGGVACILASSWISLVAPHSEGMLWNKQSFGPDLAVAFDVEENSEWFGWRKNPSHIHYPYDNIRIAMSSDASCEKGYVLEVNSRNRTATVLYRNGKEASQISQKSGFPIRYHGGHAPYSPRKNRIMWVKKGARHTVVINGRPVLEYTDPDPIPVERVGIGGYNTRINFSHIEIKKLPDS